MGERKRERDERVDSPLSTFPTDVTKKYGSGRCIIIHFEKRGKKAGLIHRLATGLRNGEKDNVRLAQSPGGDKWINRRSKVGTRVPIGR
jgi:hypothetical protein